MTFIEKLDANEATEGLQFDSAKITEILSSAENRSELWNKSIEGLFDLEAQKKQELFDVALHTLHDNEACNCDVDFADNKYFKTLNPVQAGLVTLMHALEYGEKLFHAQQSPGSGMTANGYCDTLKNRFSENVVLQQDLTINDISLMEYQLEYPTEEVALKQGTEVKFTPNVFYSGSDNNQYAKNGDDRYKLDVSQSPSSYVFDEAMTTGGVTMQENLAETGELIVGNQEVTQTVNPVANVASDLMINDGGAETLPQSRKSTDLRGTPLFTKFSGDVLHYTLDAGSEKNYFILEKDKTIKNPVSLPVGEKNYAVYRGNEGKPVFDSNRTKEKAEEAPGKVKETVATPITSTVSTHEAVVPSTLDKKNQLGDEQILKPDEQKEITTASPEAILKSSGEYNIDANTKDVRKAGEKVVDTVNDEYKDFDEDMSDVSEKFGDLKSLAGEYQRELTKRDGESSRKSDKLGSKIEKKVGDITSNLEGLTLVDIGTLLTDLDATFVDESTEVYTELAGDLNKEKENTTKDQSKLSDQARDQAEDLVGDEADLTEAQAEKYTKKGIENDGKRKEALTGKWSDYEETAKKEAAYRKESDQLFLDSIGQETQFLTERNNVVLTQIAGYHGLNQTLESKKSGITATREALNKQQNEFISMEHNLANPEAINQQFTAAINKLDGLLENIEAQQKNITEKIKPLQEESDALQKGVDANKKKTDYVTLNIQKGELIEEYSLNSRELAFQTEEQRKLEAGVASIDPDLKFQGITDKLVTLKATEKELEEQLEAAGTLEEKMTIADKLTPVNKKIDRLTEYQKKHQSYFDFVHGEITALDSRQEVVSGAITKLVGQEESRRSNNIVEGKVDGDWSGGIEKKLQILHLDYALDQTTPTSIQETIDDKKKATYEAGLTEDDREEIRYNEAAKTIRASAPMRQEQGDDFVHSYEGINTIIDIEEVQTVPSYLKSELAKYGDLALPPIIMAEYLYQSKEGADDTDQLGIVSPDNKFIVINTDTTIDTMSPEVQTETLHHELITYLLHSDSLFEEKTELLAGETEYSKYSRKSLEAGFVSSEATNNVSDDFSEIALLLITGNKVDGEKGLGELINTDTQGKYTVLKEKAKIVQSYLIEKGVTLDPKGAIKRDTQTSVKLESRQIGAVKSTGPTGVEDLAGG